MANTVNVNDVRTKARQLADMENTTFISDAEILSYLDWAYKRLYNKITESHEDWFLKEYTFNTVSGTDTYSVPTDFYKLLALDVKVGDRYRGLDRFTLSERNKLSVGHTEPSHYSLYAQLLRLYPAVVAVHAMRVWYVPVPAALTAGGTFDAIQGWDEWIAHDAAIVMLQKEESDPSILISRQNQIMADITSFMTGRDQYKAPRMRDVETEFDPIMRWRT